MVKYEALFSYQKRTVKNIDLNSLIRGFGVLGFW
ncbi:MAG: hypothetical protein ACI8YC_001616, partial [Salibacteraceae bacterium]